MSSPKPEVSEEEKMDVEGKHLKFLVCKLLELLLWKKDYNRNNNKNIELKNEHHSF